MESSAPVSASVGWRSPLSEQLSTGVTNDMQVTSTESLASAHPMTIRQIQCTCIIITGTCTVYSATVNCSYLGTLITLPGAQCTVLQFACNLNWQSEKRNLFSYLISKQVKELCFVVK